jgi:hypothetical protein
MKQTTVNLAATILAESRLLLTFWADALGTVAFVTPHQVSEVEFHKLS